MPLDFSRKHSGNAPRRRRPPPDYGSRGVKLRLFVIIGSVMMVAMVIAHLRDPSFWTFLGVREPGIAGGPPLTEAEIATKHVDTRVRTPSPEAALQGTVPLASGGSTADAAETNLPPLAENSAESSEQIAWEHGWSTILNELKLPDRTLLFQVARAGREGTKLSDEQIAAWLFLSDKLDAEWRRYRNDALKAVDDLPANERTLWLEVVAQLDSMWTLRHQPVLAAIAVGEALVDDQRQTLDDLQQTLDSFALAMILDGTIDRPQEKEAWFRLWEQLQTATEPELRKRSLGPIGFLQLYEQPKDYRGKLVTVRGTVQQGYHITESKNPHGIAGYYVFTLRPAGGPPRPIIIYALETPPGFPAVADRDIDKSITTLHEEVEFTGFFFKKWAYQAKDGINLAPLLLAKSPRWEGSSAPTFTEPNTTGMIVIVVACAVGALGLVVWLFKRT